MNKNESSLEKFDPNGPGIKGNLFGLPGSVEQADLVIVPVPWEVTCSQQTGTARAPLAILNASAEIDLFSKSISEVWKLAAAMLPFPQALLEESDRLRVQASQLIRALENGERFEHDNIPGDQVNEGCENLNTYVSNTIKSLLREHKMVGLLGGDHSTPLGFLRALNEQFDRFGILHIDAHADLRKRYEGFAYSHASIMYNALKLPAVARIIQLGVRDYCQEESEVISRSMGRVLAFFDEDLKENGFRGKNWDLVCTEIIRELPQQVYISFDIDGLDPKLCPHTGTPVPGGLEFDQVKFLIRQLVNSGKKIIGFDLCEVSGLHYWDAQVGARVLFELCCAMTASNGRTPDKIRMTQL